MPDDQPDPRKLAKEAMAHFEKARELLLKAEQKRKDQDKPSRPRLRLVGAQ